MPFTAEERRLRNLDAQRRYRERDPEQLANLKDRAKAAQRTKYQRDPAVRARLTEKARLYYAANKESARASQKRYRTKYPEKKRNSTRKWTQKNPDKIRDAARRYRAKHSDDVRRRALAWERANQSKRAGYKAKQRDNLRVSERRRRATNPEMFRSAVRRYRALRRGAPVSDLTTRQW